MSLASEALRQAQLGYHVHPLYSPGPPGRMCDCHNADCTYPGNAAKHPRTMHGLADATTDEEKVTTWWETFPKANIGVATGAISGFVALDIDPRNGGDVSLAELIKEHGPLPRTVTCNTGGGGQHYYFRHPGGRVGNGKPAEGIDLKGDGGYVITPPSLHALRVMYEWEEGLDPWSCELADMPVWLYELTQQKTVNDVSNVVPDVIPIGERDNTLASLAGTMRRRGMSQEAIVAALQVENKRCEEPLGEAAIHRIARSIMRYPPAAPDLGVILPGQQQATPGQPVRLGNRPAPYEPAPFSAAELMAMVLAEQRWAVPTLLPEGLGVLAGKPKVGKSWMAFHLAIAIAFGGVAMGALKVPAGDALVLALEDNKRRLQSRLKKLLRGSVAPPNLQFEIRWPREDEGGVEAIEQWLIAHPDARLVVIDTLAKFRKRVPDAKYADDYAAIEGLQQLAGKYGVCILLVHHLRKAVSEDWVDAISGTLGIGGAADSLLGLFRARGAADAELKVTGRDVDEQELALQWDPQLGQWNIIGDAEAYRMGRETVSLITAIRELGGHMVHLRDIAGHVERKKETVRRTLDRAARDGHVIAHGRGYYSTVTPVEADDNNTPNSDIQTSPQVPLSESVSENVTSQVTRDVRTVRTESSLEGEKPASTSNGMSEVSERSDASELSYMSEREGDQTFRHVPPRARAYAREGEAWPTREDGRPEQPCPECGQDAWSLRVGNRWMCSVCVPAVQPVRPQLAGGQA